MIKPIDPYKVVALLISIGLGMVAFLVTYYAIGLLTTPFLEWVKRKLIGMEVTTKCLALSQLLFLY